MIDRLVVLNDVSVARGGATSVAFESIRLFRKQGVSVTLIAGDDGRNAELEALGVEMIGLNQSLLLHAKRSEAVLRGLYNSRTIEVIGAWVVQNDTPKTIYHVHTWTKTLSPSLFAALRPVLSRLIVTAHDFFLVCPNGGYVSYRSGRVCTLRPMSLACVKSNCDKRSYMQKLWRVARQASCATFMNLRKNPPLVVAVHDGMRKGLERGGVPSKAIRILRNPARGFSQKRIAAEDNREALFIGRLSFEKGADIAAAAAARAGINLRIVGDGPMRETMQRMCPKAIFEGQRTHDDIAKLIGSARAVIMSSRYPEPFGLVALEAMWSGVPIFTADSALMADEIVARGAGVSFDHLDGSALENALRRTFGDDAQIRRMSENAFARTRDLAPVPAVWGQELAALYADRLQSAAHIKTV